VRFVLGNRLLDRAGGTEIHLLTLAEQLQQLGHEVCLYSPVLGPFSEHVRSRGIEVTDALRELPERCDAVLSQDTIVLYELARRYPAAFHAYRICGDTYDFQMPPQLPGVVDLIVVVCDRHARLARACAAEAPVLQLRTPVDAARLVPVAPLRERPARAVLLGNYLERDALVREAWAPHGIEVMRIGGPHQRYDLAAALADADIVVAKARAALDAMACGRAVYVFDVLGGDGWVTPDTYALFEADQFAGRATGRVIGLSDLERDLADYDPRMGTTNRDLIAQHHDPRMHAVEFVHAVAGRTPGERPDAPLRELARLTALSWSWERLVTDLQLERARLIERIQATEERLYKAEEGADHADQWVRHLRQQVQVAADRLAEADRHVRVADDRVTAAEDRVHTAERGADEAAALAARERTELESIRATRAWRLARSYWRTRDRLRALRRSVVPRG
jgi:hypothetical protein